MLEGLEGTDNLDTIKQEFSPGVTVNNTELAENILKADTEKKRKFSQTFEVNYRRLKAGGIPLHRIPIEKT
jgi:hypothetical protein